MKIISFIFSLLCVLQLSTVSAKANATDVAEIAKVCMDVESALQDFILIGMHINYGNPEEDMKIKIHEIEAFIKDVSNHDISAELHHEVDEIKTQWEKIKPEFLKQPDKTTSVDLQTLVNEFVHMCEELDEHLAKDAADHQSNIIVLVSEMGIEVQGIAVNYLLKAWGIEDPNYVKTVTKELQRFQDINKKLVAEEADQLTGLVKDKVDLINKNFLVFKFMALSKSGRLVPAVVEKNAQKIINLVLEVMDLEESA